MSTLHLVSSASLDACLARCADGDAVLLLGDGVWNAVPPRHSRVGGNPAGEMVPRLRGNDESTELLVLGPDLATRGLAKIPLAAGIQVVDNTEFVHLATTHDVVQTWF